MQKKRMAIVAGSVAVLVIGLLSLLFTKQLHKPDPNLIIKLAPSAATMWLDGKTTKAGSYNLPFGRHTITASFSGFGSYSKDIYVKGATPQTVLVVLSPNSDEGLQYLKNHPSEQYLVESLAGQQFSQTSRQVTSQNPIIRILPHVSSDNSYRIDYGAGNAAANDLTQTIYISAINDTATQAALDWITSQGYNTSTLNVIKISEPLLSILPYNSIDFDLAGNYVSGPNNRPVLTLTATIHLSTADQSDRQSAIDSYKQEVLDFITSSGGNPSSYTITYNISDT